MRSMVDGVSFDMDFTWPFFSEGFYSGWLARHHGVPLEDTRVHPDQLKKLVPSLRDR